MTMIDKLKGDTRCEKAQLLDETTRVVEDLTGMMQIVHSKVESLFLSFNGSLVDAQHKASKTLLNTLADMNNDFLVATFGAETVLSRLEGLCRRLGLAAEKGLPPDSSEQDQQDADADDERQGKLSLH